MKCVCREAVLAAFLTMQYVLRISRRKTKMYLTFPLPSESYVIEHAQSVHWSSVATLSMLRPFRQLLRSPRSPSRGHVPLLRKLPQRLHDRANSFALHCWTDLHMH